MPIPIIGGGASSATGPTLLRLRRLLAEKLGFYLATTVSTTATHGEASRVAIVNEIRDDEMAYPLLASWLYARTGDQAGTQRRILDQREAGYQGSKGAVVLSRPFSAALASGDVVEITGPLPVKQVGMVKGLNDVLNLGLRLVRVRARLSLTGNGTYQHSLASYPWLTSEHQLIGTYDTTDLGATYPPQEAIGPPRLIENGVTRTLVLDYAYTSGTTFYLDVIVSADRLVYDGSAWSYVSDANLGLLDDDYQAACPEGWALAFGMHEGLTEIAKLLRADRRLPADERAMALDENERQRQAWARTANRIRYHEFPRPNPARPRGLVSLGVTPPRL